MVISISDREENIVWKEKKTCCLQAFSQLHFSPEMFSRNTFSNALLFRVAESPDYKVKGLKEMCVQANPTSP